MAVEKGGLEVLPELQVVEPVAPLEALPHLVQVGAIDEPGGTVVQRMTRRCVADQSECFIFYRAPGGWLVEHGADAQIERTRESGQIFA
ncbi:MAG: hypothetical protein WDO74_10785 [Pseudomonadota bacterium]